MKKTICGALVALGLAVPLSAELSKTYSDWAEGPVQWLLTDEELDEWKRIETDAEAGAFIDLFWARRDPTPGTPANEWKTAFEQRVEIADQKFGDSRIRGSLSDRGRTFILLGSPFRRSIQQISPTGARPTPDSPLDPDLANTSAEVWHYEKDSKPEFIEGADFEIEFIDERGRGEYRLSTIGRRNPKDLFEQARRYYLFQPDLQAAPSFAATAPGSPAVAAVEVEEVSTEFESEYLKAAYEEFKAAAEPDDDDLHLTYGEYITPGGRYFVPVQLYVPASAGIDTSGELTFFGVIEKGDGEIVAVYEEPVTLVASNNDAFYDKSLMLQPGNYTGTFGLAKENAPVAMAKTELVLEGLAADEPSVSGLILSNNVYPLSEAQEMTDPYAFGGLKVVPKGDATFDSDDEIWYFLELRNPGLNAEGQPTVRVKLDVEGKRADGTPVKMSAPMMEANAQPVKDTPGHYMVGSSFPPGSFAPGSYTFKAKVFDANAKMTWNLERPFTVIE